MMYRWCLYPCLDGGLLCPLLLLFSDLPVVLCLSAHITVCFRICMYLSPPGSESVFLRHRLWEFGEMPLLGLSMLDLTCGDTAHVARLHGSKYGVGVMQMALKARRVNFSWLRQSRPPSLSLSLYIYIYISASVSRKRGGRGK